MARPKKDIDPEQVRKLAAIQCSYAEMAAVLGCDPKTLSNRFSQAIEKGREEGKASLKRKQFEVAISGNPTMLIWLGKQLLDQKDQQEQQHSGGVTVRVIRKERRAIEIGNGNGHHIGNGRLKALKP